VKLPQSAKLPPGIRRLFRLRGGRARILRDLDEEMRFHLEMRVEELRAIGMSEADAKAEALRRFGGTDEYHDYAERRSTRRARRLRVSDWLTEWTGDVRFALRQFRRSPGFTIAVLLILALGIGVSTAMFTIFKTVLVDRLPIREQDRVVVMHTLDRSGRNLDVPYAYLAEIARDSALVRGVAGVAHFGAAPQPLMDRDTPVVFSIAYASPNYFEVLGVRPVVGRLLRPEDGQPGAPPVIVLSYSTWRLDFGGDPSAVGRSLVDPYTQQRVRVVGVAPAGFEYPSGSDMWMPISRDQGVLQVDIVARLAPNVTVDAARRRLFALAQRLNPFASVPPTPGQPTVTLEISGVTAQSFADTVLGGSRPPLIALTIAVGLLLLIACVNIGNLSLVRLLGRTREVAVRRAIGASSADVVRLFAVENVLLGVLGGALGLVTALAVLRLVRSFAPPQVPRIDTLGSLGTPLAAAVGITLIALLLFGVAPSFVASRIRSYAVLRSDSRSGTESRSVRRARHSLVAMQVALAVILLGGAGLLVRTLAQLKSVELGYRPEHLSIVSFTSPQSTVPTPERLFEVGKQLVRRLEATPGVMAATPIENEPFKGQSFFIMKVAKVEQPVTEREHNPFIPFEFGGPDYFRTFRIPILRGRGFAASDTRGAERVVVVNEALAKQLWPNDDALGKRLVQVTGPTRGVEYTVVGVASDTRFRELRDVAPVAYFDWEQVNPFWSGRVAVRTTRPLATMLPALRAATHDANAELVLWNAQTMDKLLDAPLAQPRLSALLLSGFSLTALLLSGLGLYGVMAAGVRRQTHEIGVRVALGAMPGNIRRLVLGQVVGVVGIGVIAGLAGALATSRLLRSMLFDVSPIDPLTLAGTCILLLAVAMIAGYLPARRAARIDPVEALRAE
jgi:predicted permease